MITSSAHMIFCDNKSQLVLNLPVYMHTTDDVVVLSVSTACTATALRGSSALTELRLKWCHINGVAMSQLHKAISTIPTLSILDLSHNNLGSEGASYLGKNQPIKSVSL